MEAEKIRELVHKYNELDREISEWESERESIKNFLINDPVASYRLTTRRHKSTLEVVGGEKKVVKKSVTSKIAIMSLYTVHGEIPPTITRKQAEVLLQGMELKRSVLDEKGKVRTAYIIDQISDHFGMSEQEFLDHLDKIHKLQEEYNDLGTFIDNAKEDQKDLGISVGKAHVIAKPEKDGVNPIVYIAGGLILLSLAKHA